jgi:predicted O-methyltransferase YrrM
LSRKTWTAVDRYITDTLVGPDPVLDAAIAASNAAGLPTIAVSPNEGRLLHILAKAIGARRILEIGTLGGYSTIWLARALPADGRLVTLEYEPRHAEVARKNIARAGLSERIDIRVGPALETLPKLAGEGLGPYDLTFIDADKENNPDYFSWALKLSRRGSLIVVDNVVRDGEVADARSRDPMILGIRRMNELIASEPRVTATAIQTVGARGYDGFAIALVTADI